MQKYMRNIQICKNVAKYVKICKNAKNNMQIFKFFQANNRFQRSQIQIKPTCYFMSYMQICKNPKSRNYTQKLYKIYIETGSFSNSMLGLTTIKYAAEYTINLYLYLQYY